MEQVRFRGKACVICKGAERVDGGMDEDAGKQAAAAIKDRDQQEADWQERAVCKVHTVSASCSFG